MPALRACFEAAGFDHVRTVLSSGNVVFDAPTSDEHTLERKAEQAMQEALGRSFYAIVRPTRHLAALLASAPYHSHGIPVNAKRVVTFLREACDPRIDLPFAKDHASVFCMIGREVFTAYLPTDKGPVFMQLIERAFGKGVTTRTFETVAKCAAA